MQENSEKLDFYILLESEEVKKSPDWQKQCRTLYDLFRQNLSEGSIDPASQKGKEGEKTSVVLSYDTLSLAGITLNSFYILIKLINFWEKNKKTGKVKLITKNKSEFILSNLSVKEVLEIYEKLQQEEN